MKNFANNKIVIGVAGLIVGLVIGWFIGGATSKSDDQNQVLGVDQGSPEVGFQESFGTNGANNSKWVDALLVNTSNAEESDAAILVGNQQAGSIAMVGSVETNDSTWVVVREDKNGVFGNILGASRVDGGASSNITIELLRPTRAGQTYRVVLFKDNGDGEFDYRNDIPLVSEGVAISQAFQAL